MSRPTRRRRVNWYNLLLLGVLVYFAAIIFSQVNYLVQVHKDQVYAEERLAAATAENTKLQAELQRLEDNDYIEKLAREELGMTGEGEIPYAPGKRSHSQAKNNKDN